MNSSLVPPRRVAAALVLVAAVSLAATASAQLRMPPQDPAGTGPRLSAPSGAAPVQAPPPPGDTQPPAAPAVRQVDRVVAIVNNEVITQLELERRVARVSGQLSRQRIGIPPREVLLRQLLEQMIIERAQLQLARDNGIRVEEQQVDRAIEGVASENGLSVAQLRERIESEGQSFASFRRDIRSEIARARLREREVDSKIVVSEADIDVFLASQAGQPGARTEYRIAQILIRVPEGATPDQIESRRLRAEELRKRVASGEEFGKAAAAFSDAPDALSGGVIDWRSADRLPEIFAQAVVSMKPGQLSTLLRSPAGFHVLRLLDRREPADSLAKQGPAVTQTRTRHILIRPNEVMTEDEALRRLREIRQRIEGGTADFAEMARQYSTDGSAGRGGDLGWVYPGDTVPQFERVMNALQPGQISEPVRTPFGIHLIQVLERRSDGASPERVRQQAREALRARRIDERFDDWLRQLRDSTYVEYRLEGN